MSKENLNSNNNSVFIEGTCMDFCPSEEVCLRVREKMVHVLEATNSGLMLVKSYSRSAADANMALPRLLRPYSVLLNTLEYLMFEVSNRQEVKKWVVYDFIDDRLRAIRQDMTIQRIPPEQCIVLLEPMIRFYVYYSFRLCECSPSEYDPVLNKKYMLECIKWFLSCYTAIDRTKEYSPLSDITNRIEKIDLKKPKLVVDRVLVESLYILCNLGDVHPLYRYLQLPESVKSISALKVAYNISLANYKGNFVKIMKLSKRLCPLAYAALCLYLPILQKKALRCMSLAYNSKQFSVPGHVVKSWLLFGSAEDVSEVCSHYGLTVNTGVTFNNGAFKDVDIPQRKRNYTAKIIQQKLEDVLTYTL